MKKKRIILDVPLEFHKEVKLKALKNEVSLKKYVLQAIVKKIRDEDK